LKNLRRHLSFAALVVGLVAMPREAAAQSYVASLNLLAGAGGSLDGEPNSGFGNRTFELGVAVPTDVNVVVAVHVGQLDLSSRSTFEGLGKAKLEYGDVVGEYRFDENFYTSGIFLGLGAYRLSGDTIGGRTDETQIGAVIGVDGEFQITHRLYFLVEVSGHYANFKNSAQTFATAHAGLAFHF